MNFSSVPIELIVLVVLVVLLVLAGFVCLIIDQNDHGGHRG